MARPDQEQSEDENTFPFEEPFQGRGNPVGVEADEEDEDLDDDEFEDEDDDDVNSELRAQLASSQRSANQDRAMLRDYLMRSPTQEQAPPAPERQTVEEPMPDPYENKEGFEAWVRKNANTIDGNSQQYATQMREEMRQEFAQQNAKQAADRAGEDRFKRFVDRHPKLAGRYAMVKAAAAVAGVTDADTEEEIFRKTEKQLSADGFPLDHVDSGGAPRRKQRKSKKGSLGLGGSGTGKRRRRKSKEEAPPQDFFDQLSDQRHDLNLV